MLPSRSLAKNLFGKDLTQNWALVESVAVSSAHHVETIPGGFTDQRESVGRYGSIAGTSGQQLGAIESRVNLLDAAF